MGASASARRWPHGEFSERVKAPSRNVRAMRHVTFTRTLVRSCERSSADIWNSAHTFAQSMHNFDLLLLLLLRLVTISFAPASTFLSPFLVVCLNDRVLTVYHRRCWLYLHSISAACTLQRINDIYALAIRMRLSFLREFLYIIKHTIAIRHN